LDVADCLPADQCSSREDAAHKIGDHQMNVSTSHESPQQPTQRTNEYQWFDSLFGESHIDQLSSFDDDDSQDLIWARE
jgi:hypothetical protein